VGLRFCNCQLMKKIKIKLKVNSNKLLQKLEKRSLTFKTLSISGVSGSQSSL